MWVGVGVGEVWGEPPPRSNPSPSPWDWQAGEQVDYAKYNQYEGEMERMLEQPYFARVNTKTAVKRGEVAFLPCRVKKMGKGYTVSTVWFANSTWGLVKKIKTILENANK